MQTDSRPDDPRTALRLELHALLADAHEAVKEFQETEDAASKEIAADEKREAALLKGSDFARLKSKSPALAESLAAAGKAAKSQLEVRKAAGASLSVAISALKVEVTNTATRLGAVKPR